MINAPLVFKDGIILPPLDIKLKLMKQFVKVLNKHGQCFKNTTRIFQILSTGKIKTGIFDNEQIRKLIVCADFYSCRRLKEFLKRRKERKAHRYINILTYTLFVDVT